MKKKLRLSKDEKITFGFGTPSTAQENLAVEPASVETFSGALAKNGLTGREGDKASGKKKSTHHRQRVKPRDCDDSPQYFLQHTGTVLRHLALLWISPDHGP